jgi:hypothetical protein
MANLSTILKRDTAGRVATDGVADNAITIAKLSPAVISAAASLSAVAGDDCVLVSDTSAAATRKVTLDDLGDFMKTKTTSLLAVVTFNCGVGSGDSLPKSMAVAHNPHGLSVSVNANRIQLGAGTWEIHTTFSGYYNSWNAWQGSNVSEQRGAVTLQLDGGAASTVVPSSAMTFSSGGNGAFASSWQQGRDTDSIIQVKVNSSGFVTPIRRMDNIYGGVGVYSSGRCASYVYKLA